MDFYARQLKRREITQRCAFWGSERYPPNFWGYLQFYYISVAVVFFIYNVARKEITGPKQATMMCSIASAHASRTVGHAH